MSQWKFAYLYAKESNDTIYDDHSEWSLIRIGEQCGDAFEDLHLLLVTEDASDDDIVQRLFRIEAIPLCYGFNALRSKVTLGI
jgi:hypothetical protein